MIRLSPNEALQATAKCGRAQLVSRTERRPGWQGQVVVMSAEEILAEVLRLPRMERARLAEEVLSSLEEPEEEEVVAACAREIERRSRESPKAAFRPWIGKPRGGGF